MANKSKWIYNYNSLTPSNQNKVIDEVLAIIAKHLGI